MSAILRGSPSSFAEELRRRDRRRAAFVRPEILAGPPDRIEGFLEQEASLRPYGHFLRDLIRQRSHVLGAAEERVVAEAGLLQSHPGTLYGVLTNTELPRRTVTLSDGRARRRGRKGIRARGSGTCGPSHRRRR